MSTTPPQLPRLVREYIAAEKESARVWLRAEIDRLVGPLVDSVFDRLTNKLMAMNMDWDRILPGDASDGVRVVDLVKREIKEEHEMILQNVVDNVPEGNGQIGDCVKREIKEEEEDGQMTHIKKEEEEEETNEVDLDYANEGGDEDEVNANNATDIDTWFDRWMRDEVELGEPTRANLELMRISNYPQSNLTNREDDNEDHVNHNTQQQFDETNNNGGMMDIEEEEEVGDGQTRDTDFRELAANEGANEESSSVEGTRIGATLARLTGQSQANMSKSARHDKRKLKVPQARNEVTDRDNQHVEEDEEIRQIDEVPSQHVKRQRTDTTQPINAQAEVTRHYPRQTTGEAQSNEDRPHEGGRMESGQEPIGEEIATESTTNPTQPNRHLQCSHCQKSFDRKAKLQIHLRVHTGERPFQCNQCDKRFSQRGNLNNHQLIHQNVKNFQCPECEQQFTQKGESHLRTHSGERPFECRHCAKSFTTFVHRTKHEQAIHLHVKSYRCKQCGHTATEQSQIIKHIRMVHFGLPHTTKEQRALDIIDDRDPRELVEKV